MNKIIKKLIEIISTVNGGKRKSKKCKSKGKCKIKKYKTRKKTFGK
jgi:hypothetical protein